MTDARAFLDARRPSPPDALARRLLDGTLEGSTTQALLEQGLRELARSRAAGGGRSGAWHLLAADALLTYACEAALAEPDPPETLEVILGKVAAEAR